MYMQWGLLIHKKVITEVHNVHACNGDYSYESVFLYALRIRLHDCSMELMHSAQRPSKVAGAAQYVGNSSKMVNLS